MKTLITPLLCAVALFGCERSKTDTRQADRYTYDEPSPTVRDTDRPTTSTPSPNAPSAGTTGTDRPGTAGTGTGAISSDSTVAGNQPGSDLTGSAGSGSSASSGSTTGSSDTAVGSVGTGTPDTTVATGSGTAGTGTTGAGVSDSTVATGTGAAAGTTGADTKEETDRAKKADNDREKAHQQLTERLTKLDARVADLHVRADRLPPADKETFSSAFDSLSSERQAAFTSINAVRDDSKGKLDDLKKAANDKLKIYERSIDSLEDRIDKGVGRI